jgi:hypothetical protein
VIAALLVGADDGLHPSIVPVLVLTGVLLAIGVVLLVGIARGAAPPPGEVAIAYELAWDRFEFDVVWDLSGPLMRDGRSRVEFATDKRAAYAAHPELRGLVADVAVRHVAVEDDHARVTTALALVAGGELVDELLLRRHDGMWRVEGYHLDRHQPDAAVPVEHVRPDATSTT